MLIKELPPDQNDPIRASTWEAFMKHAHETYLERRLALIDEEIEEARRQAVVSMAQVGELRRRRLHLVGELGVLRDRRERSGTA
jgi:hypothetical protein